MKKNDSFVLMFLLIISLLIPFPSIGNEKIMSDDDCVKRISQQLTQLVKNDKKNKVSIFPLTYADGTYSAEGCIIADFLFTSLAELKAITLIERENIDKIVDEMVLASGNFTAETLLKKGQLLKSDLFICGTLEDLGDKLKVNIRFINASNGKIKKTDSFNLNRRIKDSNNPVWDDITQIKKDGKPFKIKVWTTKRKVKTGDELQIFFQSDKNCYVNVFSLGSSGKLIMLYPNRIHKDNFILSNKKYSIPGKNDNFSIKATPPKGINKIKVFAVTKNISLKLKSTKPSFFREIKAGDTERFRDFEVILKNTKNNQWAEAQWELILE